MLDGGARGVAYLGEPRPQVRAHQELEALELGLQDDEAEVDLGVQVAGLVLDPFDLRAGRPPNVRQTAEPAGPPRAVRRQGYEWWEGR